MKHTFPRALASILIAWPLAVACKRGSSGDGQGGASSGRSAPAASSGARPRLKEITATPPERVGTLPDGIGVPVGVAAPDARVQDAQGAEVSLSALNQHRGALLVVFYRGGWCPYCNFEIHELANAFPEYQRRGVLPVAISVDKPSKAA